MILQRFFLKKSWKYVLDMYLLGFLCWYLTEYFLGAPHINASSSQILQLKWSLLFYLPYWAFREELLFRFLPFLIIFLPKYQFSNKQIFSFVVLSSCIFGYVHGDFRAIFVQGVIGAYLSLIFWRYSFRLKNWRGMINGLIASTVVHFLYNSFLFFFFGYLLEWASQ